MELQNQLKKEAKNLCNKIEELYDFMQSEEMGKISQTQRDLLRIQLDILQAYRRVLHSRVSDLQRNNAPKKPEPPKDIVEKGQSFD